MGVRAGFAGRVRLPFERNRLLAVIQEYRMRDEFGK